MLALILPLQGGIPGLGPEHPIYYPPGVWPPHRPPVDPGYGVPAPPLGFWGGVAPPHVSTGPVPPPPGFWGGVPPNYPSTGPVPPPLGTWGGVAPPYPSTGPIPSPPGFWGGVPPPYPSTGPVPPPLGTWGGVAPPYPSTGPVPPQGKPEHPIALPPNQVWPPLESGQDFAGQWVGAYIPTVGYKYIYVEFEPQPVVK